MENEFNKLLKKSEYKIITKQNEIINGPKKYVCNYKTYIKIYINLFENMIKNNNNILKYNILDFGCGPAFSVYVGRKIYNLNIDGLDIETGSGSQDFIYRDIQKVLDIEKYINFYDGNVISLKDNNFDIILCFWSFLFDYSCEFGKENYIYPNNLEGENLLEKKIKNLMRISKKDCNWIISPKKFWNKDIQLLFEKHNNKNVTIELYQ